MGRGYPQLKETPRLKNTLARAKEIASSLGHEHIGVEHIQLAILDDGDSIPTKHLSEFTDVAAIRESLYSYIDSDWYKSPVTKYRPSPK